MRCGLTPTGGRHALLTPTFSGCGVSWARPDTSSALFEVSDTGWKYHRAADPLNEWSGAQERIRFSLLANGGLWSMARMQNFFVSQWKHLLVNALHERLVGAPGQVGATD